MQKEGLPDYENGISELYNSEINGNINGFILDGNPTDKDGLLLKHQLSRRFRCDDKTSI